MDIYITTHFCGGHHLRATRATARTRTATTGRSRWPLRADRLDPLGMGIDFRQLKRAVGAVIDELDHKNLNEHPSFQERNPSSEHIAMFLFDSLRQHAAVRPLPAVQRRGAGDRHERRGLLR